MNLFLDASAIVSMIVREPDAEELADRLDDPDRLLWSAVAKWEAVAAVARLRRYETPVFARNDIDNFGNTYALELVPIGVHESDLAFSAFERYGKGSGHPAQLNMGDCFAYACARANNARLLYKGDDFSHTDLA